MKLVIVDEVLLEVSNCGLSAPGGSHYVVDDEPLMLHMHMKRFQWSVIADGMLLILIVNGTLMVVGNCGWNAPIV